MSGDSDSPSLRVPVPAARLAPPQRLGQYVERARLLQILAATTPDQILLLSAPAGHGKTALLAEWCAPVPERTAWISLHAGDRSEPAFWSAVLAALGGCSVLPVDSPIRTMDPPRDTVAAMALADALGAATAQLAEPIRLVLDDVHVLAGSDAITALDTLTAYLRGGLQIVLATRSDPLLPLARWRVAGRLVELRRVDLAFTVPETRDLVEQNGLRLRPDQIDTLVDQTDGWAAGLRLATMSLASTPDPDAFLADLVGNDRAIADYLVSEVLSRLPADTAEILRRLSVCDQISAPLAEALTGQPGAVAQLCALERDSSLVVSHGTSREWFRIHPLLRAYLTVDLRRSDPHLMQQLYAIAARWHAAEGHPAEALDHALRANDPPVTIEIVTAHALTLLSSGRYDLLRQAWRQCPVEVIDADPTLALVFALAFLDDGEASIATELLSRADRTLGARPGGDDQDRATHHWLRALVRVRLSWLSGDLDVDQAPQAGRELTSIAGGSGAERALSHFTAALASAAAGDLVAAKRSATASVHAARLGDQPYVEAQATVILAVVALTAGELRSADELAARADVLAPREQWIDTAESSVTSGIRCYAALMSGRPREAIGLAGPSMSFSAGELAEQQPTSALATVVSAVASDDLGQHNDALTTIRAVRESLPDNPLSRLVLAASALWEQEIALDRGQSEDARAVLRAIRPALGATGDVFYLAACSALARGRRSAASELLAPVIDGRCPPLTPWVAISARILAGSLALEHGRESAARRLLAAALGLADHQGALRPLLKAPEPVIGQLMGDPQLAGGEHAALITQVVSLRTDGAWGGGPALTSRELEVLSMLPTLGTVSDIATDLSVSVNTVKTHLKAIYGKLGVDSRRRAVEVGRRHGYLAS